MRVLGIAAVVCASLVLVAATQGVDEKTNAVKIVGVWDLVKSAKALPEGVKLQVTFTKDGKVKVQINIKDKEIAKPDATYKIEGDKLTITSKSPQGEEKTQTKTIKSLTDTKLVIEDEKDKGDTEFKKKKD